VAAPSGSPSIAVLPFDNMSGDADKAYFADGMTEDLITDLSKVGGLVVIARNSTFQYKGKARDVREIGKALNARYVLECSVRRSGESVRVNAQLIDAASGAHVWADRYDGELKNIFALQDTIARNVVKALSVELTKDDSDRVAKRSTGNVQAYDVLLKGWGTISADAGRVPRGHRRKFKRRPSSTDLRSRLRGPRGHPLGAYTRYWGPALGLSRDTQADAERYLARRCATRRRSRRVASAMLSLAAARGAIAEAQRAVASDLMPTATSRWPAR
jgi:TolB-like protein